MKKLILCFSCIMAIVLLSGCSMDNTPTKKVENFLDNYKNQDETVIEQLKEMVDSDSLMDDDQKTTYSDIMKKQYQDLTYEIKDEVINGETATVTAEIEVYDYYKINKDAEEYYKNNPDEFKDNTSDNDDAVETIAEETKDKVEDAAGSVKDAAKDAVDSAKDAVSDAKDKTEDAADDIASDAKYVEYRLEKLKDAKDRVKYTIDFTLTKVDGKWTLNEIDDITRQKIHGLYEH